MGEEVLRVRPGHGRKPVGGGHHQARRGPPPQPLAKAEEQRAGERNHHRIEQQHRQLDGIGRGRKARLTNGGRQQPPQQLAGDDEGDDQQRDAEARRRVLPPVGSDLPEVKGLIRAKRDAAVLDDAERDPNHPLSIG